MDDWCDAIMGSIHWAKTSTDSLTRQDILALDASSCNSGSPRRHSSSYTSRLEADYLKDYVCCDIPLASMHELLQHYEEAHTMQFKPTVSRRSTDHQFPSSNFPAARLTIQPAQRQQQAQAQAQQNIAHQYELDQKHSNVPTLVSGQLSHQRDACAARDGVYMDRIFSPAQSETNLQFQIQAQCGRQRAHGPHLDLNLAGAFKSGGHRASQVNPIISSINTPYMWAGGSATPDTSAEFEFDYTEMMNVNFIETNLNERSASSAVDDPAECLLNLDGRNIAGSSHVSATPQDGVVGKQVCKEVKPFKCLVIGCEKAYKNRNGIGYHKQHGHQNQLLKENPDGTSSIVDPTTSVPYPGTVGMEIAKPYQCESCGKRYKNRNGLKYHHQQSPNCH